MAVAGLFGLAVFGAHRGDPTSGQDSSSSLIAAVVLQRLPTPSELDHRHDRFTIDDVRVAIRLSAGRRNTLR